MPGTNGGPGLVAYDGSPEARAAVLEAAQLLRGRPLLIATIWEAGLAAAPYMGMPGDFSSAYTAYDPAESIAVDKATSERAQHLAEEGAELARGAGAAAEPVAVADELDPAESLIAIAEERDAAVIVVGSRGLAGLKARVHGSTTQKLMHRTRRPVLVVRTDA
jgi:nucleotide-binding universal stress UspA family protein